MPDEPEIDVEANVTAVAAKMQKAMAQAQAPAAPTPMPPSEQADESGEEASAPKKAADKTEDPYASLKELGTPEEIREALEEAKNSKAMRREAHFKNEHSNKLVTRIEETERRVNQMYERNAQLLDAAAFAANNDNPELAMQYLKMAASQAGPGRPGNGSTPQPDLAAPLSALQKQIETLQAQQNQYAFGDGHSRVLAAALEAVERHPVFQGKQLVKLGVPDKVVQSIVDRVYQMANEDPNAVNVFDPRSYRAAVAKATKAEASFYEQLRDANVDDYRELRKAKNAQAPPSGKGGSASVRGTSELGPPLQPDASQRQIREQLTNRLLRSLQSNNRATET